MSTEAPFENIKIKGPINVVPITPEEFRGKYACVYILMGPTGSGKSSFIESLSLDGALSISKDSLESVTQDVQCYRIDNVYYGSESIITLMDTPGFLDTKLSESRITSMIIEKLDALCQFGPKIFVGILYFLPITDIRMSGSKRDAIKLLHGFMGSFGAKRVDILTTMWNTLWKPKQIEDANTRMHNLKAEIFKKSGDLRIRVHKFEFEQKLALSVFNHSQFGWLHDDNTPKRLTERYKALARDNLVQRIDNTYLQLKSLKDDKQRATAPGTNESIPLEIIQRAEAAALATLESFMDDLNKLDPEFHASLIQTVQRPLSPLYLHSPMLQSFLRLPTHLSSSIPPSPRNVLAPLPPIPTPSPSRSRRSAASRIRHLPSTVKGLFKKNE